MREHPHEGRYRAYPIDLCNERCRWEVFHLPDSEPPRYNYCRSARLIASLQQSQLRPQRDQTPREPSPNLRRRSNGPIGAAIFSTERRVPFNPCLKIVNPRVIAWYVDPENIEEVSIPWIRRGFRVRKK